MVTTRLKQLIFSCRWKCQCDGISNTEQSSVNNMHEKRLWYRLRNFIRSQAACGIPQTAPELYSYYETRWELFMQICIDEETQMLTDAVSNISRV